MNLYLIDGNSYVYRAYYAIRGLTNAKGFPTNAIFGFTNMLMKIIREKKPEGLVVAFDSAAPTERHRVYENYKANRPEAPDDLALQFGPVREVIAAFRIPVIEIPGYEADDIIGTVAKRAAEEGEEVFIVTSDKDMLQLVDEHIRIYDPMKDRILDLDAVREKFGVDPGRVTEFMALTGDATDNIPGVRGIGEKTAKELLALFPSLDDLLDHPEKIPREKLRKLITDNREAALLSRQLATIDTNVPVEFGTEDFRVQEPDWLSLLTHFREFDFTSLMKLLPQSAPGGREYEIVSDMHQLAAIVGACTGEIAFDTEATGVDPLSDSLVGISLCCSAEKAYYVPLGHADAGEGQMDVSDALGVLGPFFGSSSAGKIGHNLKYDIMLLRRQGATFSGPLFDTMIAAYLLNPNRAAHGLDEVAFEYLSKRKRSFREVVGKRPSFAEVPVGEAAPYAGEDAALAFELKDILFRKLGEQDLERVYFEIEMPLIPVLVDMEEAGIRIDSSLLLKLSKDLAAEIGSLQKRIYFLAGQEFNINSPKQLAKVLFQDLGLSPSKKTKTGFSTGMDVLEELAGSHDLPREVLHYRSLTKLKTTYIDILPAIVHEQTGRVHTSFNQTVTATGRLSSSDPNLQNIPIRGDWGKRIRGAFIADEGNILLSADYSQVELRILAHLCGDEGLIQAFREDLDIHTRTAAEIYGVPFERVTPDMRRTAKSVNFGVIYGMSSFGLSEALRIERAEADRFIKQYFDRHPGVRAFIAKTIGEAKEEGYVTTLSGRKRPIPEFASRNRNIRQQAERLAVNSPIQGTAADVIKIAMIRIRDRFLRESPGARMILQVHDELLFELPEAELPAVREIVRHEMEQALVLSVPLKVEIGHGRNWAEAH